MVSSWEYREMPPAVREALEEPLFGFGIRWQPRGTSVVDFVEEFASTEEREQCAAIQRRRMEALATRGVLEYVVSLGAGTTLSKVFLGLPIVSKDQYTPPLEITLDASDYIRAATEWILEPEKYRIGPYTGPFAGYDSASTREQQTTSKVGWLKRLFGTS